MLLNLGKGLRFIPEDPDTEVDTYTLVGKSNK